MTDNIVLTGVYAPSIRMTAPQIEQIIDTLKNEDLFEASCEWDEFYRSVRVEAIKLNILGVDAKQKAILVDPTGGEWVVSECQ